MDFGHDMYIPDESQYRKTERQKDRKTERQKDRKTERNERQKETERLIIEECL